MKILTQYSKSKNITNLNDVSQKEYIEQVTLNNTQIPDDYSNPYTFDQWFNRNVGIAQGQEQVQYQNYLRLWYQQRYTTTDAINNIKNDYISFLKELTLVLNKEGDNSWLTNINYDDPFELDQAITFFSKKIKEIGIYLANKRESIKQAKLKYNIAGSTQAFEKLFYEYLLKAFTQRDYVLNVPEFDIYNQFPQLSSVNNTFQIKIEELYDDTNYFDKDPTQPVSAYFPSTSPEVTAYYESLGLDISAYDWLFQTGFNQLCANNPLVYMVNSIANIPLSDLNAESGQINDYLKFELTKRYIGENQNYISGGYYIPYSDTFKYDIQTGNNWFYWPSGEYIEEIPDIKYDLIALSSTILTSLSDTTGAENYLKADKIFLQHGTIIEGAWLKSTKNDVESNTMSATLEVGINTFNYPYPGYGISGEDLDWTGRQLDNIDATYNYLDEDTKTVIKQLYWTVNTTTSSLCSINIHDTSIIANGGTSDELYENADKLTIRIASSDSVHDSIPDSVYKGQMKHAYLYKPNKTDIPIKRGKNYINWPLNRYDNNELTNFFNIVSNQCNNVNLSSINISGFIGSRAGYDLFDSDIIYKLDGRNGLPLEAAYLGGTSLSTIDSDYTTFTNNATGTIQSTLSLRCNAGQYVTFIWSDEDTDIEDVMLKHVNHQPDCPYLYEKHYSLLKENPSDKKPEIDYYQWKKCECKAITYSPLGHPGSNFEDYKGYADIIFADLEHPTPFSFKDWRGIDGLDFRTSEDFAWFQLNGNTVEPDIGWGEGNWVAGGIPSQTRTFTFKKGVQYKYLRCSLGHENTFLTNNSVPFLVIKHQYVITPKPRWYKAELDAAGQWISTNKSSDMTLKPSDYLVYDHIDSNWYCITSIGTLGTTTSYNTSAVNINNNRWIDYNYVTSGKQVRCQWPTILYSNNGTNTLAYELSGVNWKVTKPGDTERTYKLTNNEPLDIFCDTVGTWTIKAKGKKINDDETDYLNVVSLTVSLPISTVSTSGSYSIQTIYADTINMSINATLTNSIPFWGKASDQDDKITKHKGANIYGGGIQVVDDYTLISQPEFSDITLNMDTYVEYEAKNTFVWVQPLSVISNTEYKDWCKLEIDNKISTLSSFIYNNPNELVVSASNELSDLIIEQTKNNIPVFVNYWSNNDFIWEQSIYSSMFGIPPTGGRYITLSSDILLEAFQPYANLTNRHYPTIASIPYMDNLYTVDQVGGYYIPRLIATNTYISKNNENFLDTTYVNVSTNRGLSGIYQNIDVYETDQGFSRTDRISPVSTYLTDSGWMKASVSEGFKAGIIEGNDTYPTLIPYQTKYETTKQNNIGLVQQGDKYDPWIGDKDDEWRDNTNWPSDFKKQFKIDEWYNQFQYVDKNLYQWKCDIFNNQYGLLKSYDSTYSIHDKIALSGELYVRDYKNIISKWDIALSGLYNICLDTSSISADIDKILDIDVWYDTLLLKYSNALVISKIDFNFETSILDFNIDNTQILTFDSNKKYCGLWLFEQDKNVSLSFLTSSTSGIYPEFYNYNINNNILQEVYINNLSGMNEISTVNLTSISDCLLTYNENSLKYNITFKGNSSSYAGMLLASINIKKVGNELDLDKLVIITPWN